MTPPATPLRFGTATASFQVEGASTADGRGPSIWDTLCAVPGAIADGSDGSVACGSYERWPEDLALLERLGAQLYRFSIAWPRVQPSGSGPVNPKGLDYYERVVDDLLEHGIQPLPTLYHWDLPQPLEDAGGWPVRDTALRFAEYAGIVLERLGDRVPSWATLNEPWCSAFLGYAAGIHAPARTDADAAFAAAHHLLLAHALGARAIREQGAEVGIVLNLTPIRLETPEAAGAASLVDAIHNRIWLDPLLDGSYAEDLRAIAPPLRDPEVVRDGDFGLIKGSADWLGINYYSPARIGAGAGDAAGGVGQAPTAYPNTPPMSFYPRPPYTDMGWEVDPSGMEELLLHVSERAPGLPLMVTENGAAYPDEQRDADGRVRDDDRIDYLRTHIEAVERARAAGADVRAYLAWSLLDNFEWAEGYIKKFGIVEIEQGTLRRIPKHSFDWYAERIARETAGHGGAEG